jgi:hypothetical protein
VEIFRNAVRVMNAKGARETRASAMMSAMGLPSRLSGESPGAAQADPVLVSKARRNAAAGARRAGFEHGHERVGMGALAMALFLRGGGGCGHIPGGSGLASETGEQIRESGSGLGVHGGAEVTFVKLPEFRDTGFRRAQDEHLVGDLDQVHGATCVEGHATDEAHGSEGPPNAEPLGTEKHEDRDHDHGGKGDKRLDQVGRERAHGRPSLHEEHGIGEEVLNW